MKPASIVEAFDVLHNRAPGFGSCGGWQCHESGGRAVPGDLAGGMHSAWWIVVWRLRLSVPVVPVPAVADIISPLAAVTLPLYLQPRGLTALAHRLPNSPKPYLFRPCYSVSQLHSWLRS